MFDDHTLHMLAEMYEQQCGVIDVNQFREDVLRFVYIGRLFRRYANGNGINLRLLINHCIIVHNVFDTTATSLLFDYIDRDLHGYLCALLKMFSRLPVWHEHESDPHFYELLQQEISNG